MGVVISKIIYLYSSLIMMIYMNIVLFLCKKGKKKEYFYINRFSELNYISFYYL